MLLVWLDAYVDAFERGRRRLADTKAEHAYLQEHPGRYWVFSAPSRLEGTEAFRMGYALPDAYRCEGPLLSLWPFREQEPVVVPEDLAWTMVYVDPDPLDDGPWFSRATWQVPPRGFPNPRDGRRRRKPPRLRR